MSLNDAMSGYKKLSNAKGYGLGDMLSLMNGTSYSFGEPKLGKVGKKEAIVFEGVGRFTVYVQVSPKSIEISRVFAQGVGLSVLKELGASILTDANAKDTAVADRAVDELYEVINRLLTTGVAENKSSASDSFKLYMRQKILTIKDKYDICDENQNSVYWVEGNLVSLGYKIEDAAGNLLLEIKKKLVSVMPEYTIKQNGKDIGKLRKKIKLTRPVVTGEINGKALEIKGDLSGYHFSIKLDDAVIGDVDTERLTWGDVYSIDIRDKEQQDIIVGIAVVVDNLLKNKG